ncbi:SAM-dependent methyltransferase [Glycomyces buryatensis]|uniref:SAM-dependent methyltransferase n=1 Tax=Glycomyces buryatensis TaxID=2570927 RepID=A0A4S8PZQ3_9ACTN|nr:SAM-dependent methyltransferase [Glycomyces buryatensis]THV37150.1 SAM-dependent methyltransferase [Glycomyces buryatensis]
MNEHPSFTVKPIGTVRTDRTDVQDTDHWGGVRSVIEVDARFGDDCMQGLEDFSHVEVLFVFDQFTEPTEWTPLRSRGRDDMPAVGVFSSRGPRRPNRIGVTACPIVAVRGRELTVTGLDAVDGTPVLDLKPVMEELRPTDVRQPEWVGRLMSEYF